MKSVIGTHLMKKIGLGLAVSGLQMAKYLSADTATTMNIQPLFAMFLNGCQKYGNINLYLKEEKKTSLFIQYLSTFKELWDESTFIENIFMASAYNLLSKNVYTRNIFQKNNNSLSLN